MGRKEGKRLDPWGKEGRPDTLTCLLKTLPPLLTAGKFSSFKDHVVELAQAHLGDSGHSPHPGSTPFITLQSPLCRTGITVTGAGDEGQILLTTLQHALDS